MAEQPSERILESRPSPDGRYLFKIWLFLLAIAFLAIVLGCAVGMGGGGIGWPAASGVMIAFMVGAAAAGFYLLTRGKQVSSPGLFSPYRPLVVLLAALSGPAKAGAAAGAIIGVISVAMMLAFRTNPATPPLSQVISAATGAALCAAMVGALSGRVSFLMMRRFEQKSTWWNKAYGLLIGAIVGSVVLVAVSLVLVLAFVIVSVMAIGFPNSRFPALEALLVPFLQIWAYGAFIGAIAAAAALWTMPKDTNASSRLQTMNSHEAAGDQHKRNQAGGNNHDC